MGTHQHRYFTRSSKLGNVLCERPAIFGRIDKSWLLVVGAGEVAERRWKRLNLAVPKQSQLLVVHLTGVTKPKEADELAQKFDGFTLAYSKFHESLHLFDVVLASTASAKALLTKTQVENAMRKRPSKPLFLIDASVPRNVEDAASTVDNVFLQHGRCLNDCERKPPIPPIRSGALPGRSFQTSNSFVGANSGSAKFAFLKQPLCHALFF